MSSIEYTNLKYTYFVNIFKRVCGYIVFEPKQKKEI